MTVPLVSPKKLDLPNSIDQMNLGKITSLPCHCLVTEKWHKTMSQAKRSATAGALQVDRRLRVTHALQLTQRDSNYAAVEKHCNLIGTSTNLMEFYQHWRNRKDTSVVITHFMLHLYYFHFCTNHNILLYPCTASMDSDKLWFMLIHAGKFLQFVLVCNLRDEGDSKPRQYLLEPGLQQSNGGRTEGFLLFQDRSKVRVEETYLWVSILEQNQGLMKASWKETRHADMPLYQ